MTRSKMRQRPAQVSTSSHLQHPSGPTTCKYYYIRQDGTHKVVRKHARLCLLLQATLFYSSPHPPELLAWKYMHVSTVRAGKCSIQWLTNE